MPRSPGRVTISDVAQAASVSIQTVSAVMNDKPGISEPTRERVREVVRRLNYHPNGLASSLRAQRSFTLGVMVPTITNPFFPDFIRGIEDRARQAGYAVLLCNSDQEPDKELEYLKVLRRQRVAGYILAYDSGRRPIDEVLHGLAEEGVPIVTYGTTRAHPNITSLRPDDERTASLATGHLLTLGHRRVGFIQPPTRSRVHRDRTAGFTATLAGAGLTVDADSIVPGGFTVEDGMRGAERLLGLRTPPTGIVAANDLAAIGAVAALKRFGKRVPDDVSVVGIDDIQMAALVDPPLTTVAQPIYQMGFAATDALLHQLQRPGEKGRLLRFDAELVVRASTAPPPFSRRKSSTRR